MEQASLAAAVRLEPAMQARANVVVALVPAYRPAPILLQVVEVLAAECAGVVVVDDGSGPEYAPIFAQLERRPKVEVIPHAANLGKGAALKSGINYILSAYPDAAGIVTADADGQHDSADVLKVCERFCAARDALVMGVRDFRGSVPWRSRLGNQITRRVMRALLGHNLSDSQTGLRAIPRAVLPALLKAPGSGYEFELEMLIAAKHLGLRVVEQPIRTIYEPGNPSSHFRPVRDSMRIFYVLLRFGLIGLLSAVLDNLLFYLLFHLTSGVAGSLIGARFASLVFNYSAVRKAVFLSDERHEILLPRYLLLVAANAALSYSFIRILVSSSSLGVVRAKLLIEVVLFAFNFVIQRDFVFRRRSHPTPAV